MSAFRTLLRSIEIALLSLKDRKDSIILNILEDIELVSMKASTVLYELDVLVHDKLQRTPRRRHGVPGTPKIAKLAWLRQEKQLTKLRDQISNLTGSLASILTALNSVQLVHLHE